MKLIFFFFSFKICVYHVQYFVRHYTEVCFQVLFNSHSSKHIAPGLNTLVAVINKKILLTTTPPLK